MKLLILKIFPSYQENYDKNQKRTSPNVFRKTTTLQNFSKIYGRKVKLAPHTPLAENPVFKKCLNGHCIFKKRRVMYIFI